MPIKTVREMDTRERRQYSLNTRVFNVTLINCIILGVVALLVGLNLYVYTLTRQLTDQAFSISQNAAMLPHIFPPYPEREELDLYASMEPAKETGGDFYDYFLIDDDHLCIVMADMSGKGVPEAMNTVREPFGIGRMLETLNRDLDAEPVRILNNVCNAVRDFAGAAEQFDDITMLRLEYYGAKQNSKDKGEEG